MSLSDIIKEDIFKGLTIPQIIEHIKSIPKYSDMGYFQIDTIIKTIKQDL